MEDETITLTAAREYISRGLGVFPCNGKVPATPNGFKDATLDIDHAARWFGERDRNIAIAIPRGIVVLDIDPRNGGLDTLKSWLDAHGRDWLDVAPMARTGGGGRHYFYRYDGRPLKKTISGVDFQREGKYVVAPPSTTVESYEWLRELPANLDDLPELPDWLLEEAQLRAPELREPRTPIVFGDPLNDAVHAYTSWAVLLTRHGWTALSGHDGDGSKWRHPSTTNDFSATIKHDCLFVYSPNTPFPVTEPGDPHGITLFSAFATLECNGDTKLAARILRENGYLPEREMGQSLDALIPQATVPVPPEAAPPVERDALRLGTPIDWPALKRKEDDEEQRWLLEPLIAKGRAHALYAGAKTGKSLLMLAAAAALATGRRFLDYPGGDPTDVIYCDYEMTDDDVRERLEGFGYDLDDPKLDRLHYFLLSSGDGLDTAPGADELIEAAIALGTEVVFVDTMSRAVAGPENENDTVRNFYRFTGARLKRLGVAVVRLDHAGKDREKGQRGGSAKNDDVDVVQRLTKMAEDEKAGRAYFDVETTHSRMAWVPRKVGLVLAEDDGVNTWAYKTGRSFPEGTKEVADKLAELGAPLDISARAAMALLRDNNFGRRDAIVSAAVAWRVAEVSGGLSAMLEEASGRAAGPRAAAVPNAAQDPAAPRAAREDDIFGPRSGRAPAAR